MNIENKFGPLRGTDFSLRNEAPGLASVHPVVENAVSHFRDVAARNAIRQWEKWGEITVESIASAGLSLRSSGWHENCQRVFHGGKCWLTVSPHQVALHL